MKRRIIKITPQFLLHFLHNPVAPGLTAKGVPADARVVGVDYSESTDIIRVVIESETFSAVAEGEEIPCLVVQFLQSFIREIPLRSSKKQVLVLCGSRQEWNLWADQFCDDNTVLRRNRNRGTIETIDSVYRAAVNFPHTEGHNCSEVIKVEGHERVFLPHEVKEIECEAAIAASQLANHNSAPA